MPGDGKHPAGWRTARPETVLVLPLSGLPEPPSAAPASTALEAGRVPVRGELH